MSIMPNMCPKLTTNNYLRKHSNVAGIPYSDISQHYGIKTGKSPLKHHPDPVTENKEVKLLWGCEIRTDKVIPARRPDIVAIVKTKQTTTIIDVAAPLDWKVKDREDEKILKYRDLRIEIQTPWNTKAKVIPVIVGSLGASSMNLVKILWNYRRAHFDSIN